jgi:hypothetical protein
MPGDGGPSEPPKNPTGPSSAAHEDRQPAIDTGATAPGRSPTPGDGKAARVQPTPRTRVYYNPELAQFSLGEDHPMVPNRLHLTHRLSELWGLFDDPQVPPAAPQSPHATQQLGAVLITQLRRLAEAHARTHASARMRCNVRASSSLLIPRHALTARRVLRLAFQP